MRSADELRALVDDALAGLTFHDDLSGLEEAVRYALEGGGKRVRPVLCLLVGDACGAEVEQVLPAACALELVHTFSLVHDDLPALDDDAERRGRPSVWAAFGQDVAVLAGDALLAEAQRLALSYQTTDVARALGDATLGMIGGQYLDVTGGAVDPESLNRLKTGRLFEAAVTLGRVIAGSEPETWPVFAREVGALFQLVDDLLDGDGFVDAVGEEETRRRADAATDRALSALAEVETDTSELENLVRSLAARER